jgi:hypothetical protein
VVLESEVERVEGEVEVLVVQEVREDQVALAV